MAALPFPTVPLLPGEQMDVNIRAPMHSFDAVGMLYFAHGKSSAVEVRACSLALSQYRLVLGIAGLEEPLSIPLLSIQSWKAVEDSGAALAAFRSARRTALSALADTEPSSSTQQSSSLSGLQTIYVFTVHTKHVWTHHFATSAENRMLLCNFQHRLSTVAAISYVKQLPAFAMSTAAEADDSMWSVNFGWCLYSREREYARQLYAETATGAAGTGTGSDLRPWFYLEDYTGDDPAHYTCCPTYPTALLMPRAVPRSVQRAAMAARSRARLPVITYVHLPTGAVLARAAQPLSRASSLSADAALCASLVNGAYAVVGPTAAQPPTPQPTPAPAPHTVAPPSLFDEGDGGAGGGRQSSTARAASPAPTTSTAGSPVVPTPTSAAPSTKASLLVADCRPWLAAKANAGFGGGYESGLLYDSFCRVQFFEIDNVFGVAKALTKLRALIVQYQGEDASYTNFLSDLQATQWLYHVQRVLLCSVAVATSLSGGVSALVHCTDGWDRTSQCCATAALLLDPFYRTAVGLCVLLEKEFGSFGHKFAERCGHQVGGRTRYETNPGVSGSDTETANASGSTGPKLQPSAIFTQYMDVVYQVVQQYPHAFEFTPALLAYLSEIVFACYHGSFLGNCEQERRLEGVELGTDSVWTDVLREVQREKAGAVPLRFVNDRYDATTAWAQICARRSGTASAKCGLLLPSCSLKKLRFWSELYLKWDFTDMVASAAPGSVSADPRRAPPLTRAVSWGEAFDNYLQSYIDAACRERRAVEPELVSLEAHFSARTGAAGPSAATGNGSAGRRLSEWCTFDSSVCFGCLRPFGLLSGSSPCGGCGRTYCSSCAAQHHCIRRSR